MKLNPVIAMCHIIDGMSKYVPSEKATSSITIDGEEHAYDTSKVFQLLFFGMTVVQARSALVLRYQVEGFILTIVDWHTIYTVVY